ncbi:iron-containing alcohol dehydrogenase family protein [Candidatus Desulforudis audaxviator]|uniref:Iron-containing alcohol dehydrogenase n=1 Tax=Desulforudis audaxviator (strain MP104C) TaxID=477974 RepID=B1I456_DESAP|nr:iron-containing alcohol dehydrogenase [Candidatus Desulforudis audaxviator]ACA59677.1 iron-containing alcohol dehydrogenase [Candidatus Desulforudis audaxviator MP104C]AZK59670.1 Alcohol dehydrogenase [Candidatus Desulforudis audaxviator]
MLFDILTPARVLFGPGSTYRLGEETAALGRKALLVTGRESLKKTGNIERVTQPLAVSGIEVISFAEVPPEPAVDVVEAGRRRVRDEGCTVVIGAGGGSALDAAKMIAGLAHTDGPARDYLNGREVSAPGLPFIAVPTTAGSGSELTRTAVLVDPETGRKQSVRSDYWMARTVVADPILTMSMPRSLTAQTGMDAFTHAVEAYTSRWATPYTNALSREAVRLIAQNFYTACHHPGRRDARESMLLGSGLAGMALNTARAGAVHALAHPVGVRYGLGHGVVCGVLLPYVVEFNMAVVEDKYAQLARTIGVAQADASDSEAAGRFHHFVVRLAARLEFPEKLGSLGLTREDIPELVEAALGSASLAANPRKATHADLTAILERNL